jgi:hypothetical protein
MEIFQNISRQRRLNRAKKICITTAAFAALITASFIGLSGLNRNAAYAGDCSTNSIIKCGSPSRTAFINSVKASPELQKIYAHFGLNPADYNRFITSAKTGSAIKSNNTIVVDGHVVATKVWSIGRNKASQGANPMTVPIPGAGTFYGNFNNQAFAASSIPVDVLFDANGKMQFAVMTSSCANPATGSVIAPSFSCKALQATSTGNDQWKFTTDASATNGATITKLVYNFGDGSATVTTTNPATAVNHTFTKSATVSVSVYVSVPGGGTVVLVNCKKAVTVTPPPATLACGMLTLTPGKADEQGNTPFTLAATATATNTTIKSYNFTFGDGKNTVVNSSANTASTTHTYAPGNFMASVSVTDSQNKTATSANCSKPVVVKTAECKPGVPIGSPECEASALACVSLVPTPGTPAADGSIPYTFVATAKSTNGTISSYSFDFGDNSQPQVVTTSATTANASHTFASGSFTATVTVNGKDASGNPVQAAVSTNCSQKINVNAPECKPGVPSGNSQCFTYTCDELTLTPGDNRTVTIASFKASSTNPDATLSGITIDWGDTTTDEFTPDVVVGKTHTFTADTSNVTATAHFKVTGDDNDFPADGANCTKPVSFVTSSVTPPPAAPPAVEAASTVQELVNTGAGSVAGLFAAATIVGTISYRLFLGRRLSRQ